MKMKGNISLCKQVALFAFALLYLVTVVTHFYSDNNFARDNQSQKIPLLSKELAQKQPLVLTETISVNASDSGIFSEKEFLFLPLVVFLRLLVFLPIKPPLLLSPSYLLCRTQFLFRIFPNAP